MQTNYVTITVTSLFLTEINACCQTLKILKDSQINENLLLSARPLHYGATIGSSPSYYNFVLGFNYYFYSH